MWECNSQSFTFLFSDQFVSTVFWRSAIRFFIAQWTLKCQRKYPQMKTRKSFLRNFLVNEFISQSYTYVSWSSPLTLSLRNLRRASLDIIEGYTAKGKFIISKRERKFLRKYFLNSEFIKPTYDLDLRKQCANTIFVETAKWYLGANRGQWWNRKYPYIITKEKLSEKLHCHVWMQLTELHFSLQWSVC